MTERSHSKRWHFVLGAALLIIIGVAAGLVLSSSLNMQSPLHALDQQSASGPIPASPFVSVAEKVLPAVVFIDTQRTVKRTANPFEGGPFGDFFRDFGGGSGEREMRIPASGSGFIISKDGYILTNAHVVASADRIKVRLHDGREFKAKLVGADKTSDVAVVKIDANDLPMVVEGNADDLRVGDWAVAIGNPGGLEGTVTVGVISAKGRAGLDIQGETPVYQNFIQTDAPINFGNSGGPLCNIRGEVIGINTAINPSSQGIGFAIPIELARARSLQLIEHGHVVRGYLGIRPTELTNELASGFDLPKGTKGIVVAQVESATPAAKAGIREGDIITRFAGREVTDVGQFRLVVADTPPNKEVVVNVLRDGKPMTVRAVLSEFPEEEQVARGSEETDGDSGDPTDNESGTTIDWLGADVSAITPQLTRQFNLKTDAGVVVTSLDPGSVANESGLLRGDVIKKINKTPIRSIRDLRAALKDGRAAGRDLVFFVQRGDLTTFVGVPLPQG